MKKILRAIPIIFCLICTAAAALNMDKINSDNIVDLIPQASFASAAVLLLVYVLKSVSIVFPVSVLQVAGGIIFKPAEAVLINAAGLLIVLTVPYITGALSGEELAERLTEKYPKFKGIKEKQGDNPLAVSFILRTAAIFPGDVLSMYLGACRLRFFPFLVGGLLGAAPRMVVFTLAGENALKPGSKGFIICLTAIVLLVVIPVAIKLLYDRSKKES